MWRKRTPNGTYEKNSCTVSTKSGTKGTVKLTMMAGVAISRYIDCQRYEMRGCKVYPIPDPRLRHEALIVDRISSSRNVFQKLSPVPLTFPSSIYLGIFWLHSPATKPSTTSSYSQERRLEMSTQAGPSGSSSANGAVPGPSSIPLYLINGVGTIWDAQSK